MKKFKYSLETVLDYKTQVLENHNTLHSVILNDVYRKQGEIDTLKGELNCFDENFNQAKSTGAAIKDYRLFDMCIKGMERKIDKEKETLLVLQQKEEEKKNEVVDAKVDTSRYEKLKVRRLGEYHKAEMKAEEAFTEEFVSHSLRGAEQQLSQSM